MMLPAPMSPGTVFKALFFTALCCFVFILTDGFISLFLSQTNTHPHGTASVFCHELRAQPTISKQKLILFVHSPAKRQAITLQTSTCGLIICFCALLQYEGAKKGENEEMDLTSLKKAFCFANVQQQRAFISICALLI